MNIKKIALYGIPALVLVLAIAFGVWQWSEAKAASEDLRAARDKAYYNALDGLSNLETDLSKVLIAQSTGQQTLLLSHISSLAQGVADNLVTLPVAYGADADGMKFLTQTADYAQTLATATAEGNAPNDEDTLQLATLQQKCGELRAHLENGAGFTYNASLDVGERSGIEYPSLLYDGPFSDGIRLGKAKGLTGAEITPEEALAVARAFIGEERATEVTRSVDVGGPMPAYGVTVKLNDLTTTVAVTRQGGKILWIAPETAGFETYLDVDECSVHAKAFLTSRGFGEMESSYYQQYDGIAVISFAAIQEGVILYPDLVKVQVRMDTGTVIGIEANNYWMNHTIRERLHPKLSQVEAKAFVSERLTITGARLCVIPVDDGLGSGKTELLCWEFDGTFSGGRYLVYIDAETGREAQVLKVVIGGGGVLTL